MDNLENVNNEAPVDGNPQDGAEITQEQAQRYKEQATGSSKEAQRLREYVIETEYSKAEADASSLLELHNKDPKLATAVAKKFWYDSYDEAVSTLNLDKEDDSKEESLEDRFEKLYQERKAKEQHEEATAKVDAYFKKLWEGGDSAKVYYDMITEGKSLTPDKALEFAKMATLYVKKDTITKDNFDKELASFASTGLHQNTNSDKKEKGGKTEEFAKWMFGNRFDHLFPNK